MAVQHPFNRRNHFLTDGEQQYDTYGCMKVVCKAAWRAAERGVPGHRAAILPGTSKPKIVDLYWRCRAIEISIRESLSAVDLAIPLPPHYTQRPGRRRLQAAR